MNSRGAADRTPSGETRVTLVTEGIIEAGWLFALVTVPLFVNVYDVRSFEPDKTVLFQSIVVVMVGAWILKVITGGRTHVSAGRSGAPASSRTGPVVPLLVVIGAASVWTAVSATLSVDRTVSWLGSYTRFAGAWTQLSFVVFFALTAGHLRTLRQWRRAAFAIVLTASTVAVFAVLQALGLDPRWMPRFGGRVYSTAGNPIFLAAYLGMTVFVTALTIGGRLARSVRRTRASSGGMIELGALVGAGIVHLAAIALSQSRGPLVGLLAGVFVVALLASLLARRRPESITRRPHVLWFGTVALTVAGIGVLLTVTLSDSVARSVREIPVVGRLSRALDVDPVRREIWHSVSDLITSTEPVTAPGAAPDALAALRPAIGYGPETLDLVIGRHVTDELATREAVADRSHNETFDLLATQGAVGFSLWALIYGGVFLLCLRGLGIVGSRWATTGAPLLLAGGGALGVLAPAVVTGEWAWSGLGVAVGAVLGLALLVVVATAPWRRATMPAAPPPFETWLTLAVLGAMVSHVVEIHFGILVSHTRLMFWFLLAALVAVSLGPLGRDEIPVDDGSTRRSRASRRPPSRSQRRAAGSAGAAAGREAPVLGWIVAAATAPVTYAMTVNVRLRDGIGGVLFDAMGATGETSGVPGAYLWILLWIVGIAWVLMRSTTGRASGVHRALVAAGLLALGFALFHGHRLAETVVRQTVDVEDAVAYSHLHGAWFIGIVLASVVGGGVVLGWADPQSGPSRGAGWWSVAAGLAVGIPVALVVVQGMLAALRADTLAQQGVAFSASGVDAPAVGSLEEAVALWPREPRYWMLLGQVRLAAADRVRETPRHGQLIDDARRALETAAARRPLDPDHHSNLGRVLVAEAGQVADGAVEIALLRAADIHYRDALSLSPGSVRVLGEKIEVLRRLGRDSEAEELAVRLRRIEAHG